MAVTALYRAPLWRQPDVVHAARVVHPALALAARDLDAQVGQGDVGTVTFHQRRLPVLPPATAALADEADRLAGVVAKAERAGTEPPHGEHGHTSLTASIAPICASMLHFSGCFCPQLTNA